MLKAKEQKIFLRKRPCNYVNAKLNFDAYRSMKTNLN